MKDPIVVALNALRNLNKAELKTVLKIHSSLAKPEVQTSSAPKPAKTRKKPGPKPGAKKARISLDETFPKAEAEAKS